MIYRDVLASGLSGVAGEIGFEPSPAELAAFGASVAGWPAFPDSAQALRRLKRRYRLGVITNCDDDLFAASEDKLGVEFDWVITAQEAGVYKPSEEIFHLAFDRIGLPRERILHVAQSLFHDHVTAKRLGLTTVWIDRRGDSEGSGATPAVEAAPDERFPDMAAFAAAAV
jgi:2-haloacid dehalogenase